jgi:hypothetical protein
LTAKRGADAVQEVLIAVGDKEIAQEDSGEKECVSDQ